MVRRRTLRQYIGASQHESVWSAGHPNVSAARRTSVPKLIYHSCTILITVILAIHYVSL